MPLYKARNRRTGETVIFEWHGTAPPTQADIEMETRRQRRPPDVLTTSEKLNRMTAPPSAPPERPDSLAGIVPGSQLRIGAQGFGTSSTPGERLAGLVPQAVLDAGEVAQTPYRDLLGLGPAPPLPPEFNIGGIVPHRNPSLSQMAATASLGATGVLPLAGNLVGVAEGADIATDSERSALQRALGVLQALGSGYGAKIASRGMELPSLGRPADGYSGISKGVTTTGYGTSGADTSMMLPAGVSRPQMEPPVAAPPIVPPARGVPYMGDPPPPPVEAPPINVNDTRELIRDQKNLVDVEKWLAARRAAAEAAVKKTETERLAREAIERARAGGLQQGDPVIVERATAPTPEGTETVTTRWQVEDADAGSGGGGSGKSKSSSAKATRDAITKVYADRDAAIRAAQNLGAKNVVRVGGGYRLVMPDEPIPGIDDVVPPPAAVPPAAPPPAVVPPPAAIPPAADVPPPPTGRAARDVAERRVTSGAPPPDISERRQAELLAKFGGRAADTPPPPVDVPPPPPAAAAVPEATAAPIPEPPAPVEPEVPEWIREQLAAIAASRGGATAVPDLPPPVEVPPVTPPPVVPPPPTSSLPPGFITTADDPTPRIDEALRSNPAFQALDRAERARRYRELGGLDAQARRMPPEVPPPDDPGAAPAYFTAPPPTPPPAPPAAATAALPEDLPVDVPPFDPLTLPENAFAPQRAVEGTPIMDEPPVRGRRGRAAKKAPQVAPPQPGEARPLGPPRLVKKPGETGEIDPQLLMFLGRTTAGAGAGAAVDPERPGRGMATGALLANASMPFIRAARQHPIPALRAAIGAAGGSQVSEDHPVLGGIVGGLVGAATPIGGSGHDFLKALDSTRYEGALFGAPQLTNVLGNAGSLAVSPMLEAIRGNPQVAINAAKTYPNLRRMAQLISEGAREGWNSTEGLKFGSVQRTNPFTGATSYVDNSVRAIGPMGKSLRAADSATKRIMAEIGMTPEQASVYTYSGDPVTRAGQGLAFLQSTLPGRLMTPFARTAINLGELGAAMTPLRWMRDSKLRNLLPSQASTPARRAMHEALLGTLGGVPLAAGLMGYSPGNSTVSAALGPMAMPAAVGRAIYDYGQHGGDSPRDVARALVSQVPFLGDVPRMAENPARVAQNVIAQPLPQALMMIGNRTVRETAGEGGLDDLANILKERLPQTRESLPIRRNYFGEPLERNMLGQYPPPAYETDPLAAQLADLGALRREQSPSLGGVSGMNRLGKDALDAYLTGNPRADAIRSLIEASTPLGNDSLTGQQQSRLQELRGGESKLAAGAVLSSPQFQALPPAAQQQLIKLILSAAIAEGSKKFRTERQAEAVRGQQP